MNFASKTCLLHKIWRTLGHLPLCIRTLKGRTKEANKMYTNTRFAIVCRWNLHDIRLHGNAQCANGHCSSHVQNLTFKGQHATAGMQLRLLLASFRIAAGVFARPTTESWKHDKVEIGWLADNTNALVMPKKKRLCASFRPVSHPPRPSFAAHGLTQQTNYRIVVCLFSLIRLMVIT